MIITKLRALVIAFVALVTFAFGADRMVWDSAIWECTCVNDECDWCINEEGEWIEFWYESFEEHADAFTAHFDSLTYKLSSNGRSMVNGKFVKMV